MTTVAIDVGISNVGISNTVVSILEPDTQAPETLRLPTISRLFRIGNSAGETASIQ